MTEFLIGLAALLVLLFAQMPIALALSLVGATGYAWYMGWWVTGKMVATVAIDLGSYTLSVVPLFVLMGNLVASSGLARDLFSAAHGFAGRLPGGLAISAIVASGGFAAVSGSSVASAATMTKVAYKPMREAGYADSVSLATIAAGGTLGILIPPSVVLIIYGILTEQSIAKLFIAGVLPGLLGLLCYIGAILWIAWRHPARAPAGTRTDWREKLRGLRGVGGVLALFSLVMGGLYGGAFTATEAAGIGAFGAFVISIWRRQLSFAILRKALKDTIWTTGALFPIVLGSGILSNFFSMTGAPELLAQTVSASTDSAWVVILVVVVLFILLGCIFESLSILLITIPVLLPILDTIGVDLIWLGIVIVVTIEIGLLTPPFGMNVFVMTSTLPDVKPMVVFGGLVPFLVADLVRLALLLAFPALTLFLPGLM